jgi:hypothetical protein
MQHGSGDHDGGAPADAAGPMLPYPDFPSTPVLDANGKAPADAAMLFAVPDHDSDGPCLSDPQIGSLFPGNWLRPRFALSAPGQQNLFEIRLHAAHEANDLVVYTTQTSWTMDAKTWSNLSAHIIDEPITVTVRGAVFDGTKLTAGPSLGSKGDVTIAPANAAGAIVYWTNSNGTALKGFHMGDETVREVLRPAQSAAACVGCHSSTPDGKFVAFAASTDPGSGNPGALMMRSSDGQLAQPSFVSSSAGTMLARMDQQFPVFSKAHWTGGDRVMVSMLSTDLGSGPSWEIIWTNLEAASTAQGSGWDILPRPGDPGHPGAAAFSHNGMSVVYPSASSVSNGSEVSDADLRVVPYPARAGSKATKVNGASETDQNEYYPTYSPDDRWIAFARVPNGNNSYANALAEVFAVPADGPAGTTATRLAANDPPMCTKVTSPGITNSWPKWAPDATTVGNRTYYWLTFSSKRGDGANAQLYVTPIVVEGGAVKTYPALYLWNQPAGEGNHTPAWDHFEIPIS